MQRSIDHHDSQSCRRTSSNHVGTWQDAWTICRDIADKYSATEFHQIHMVLAEWIPMLNVIFGRPIKDLENYNLTFYYLFEPNGPKEIFTSYAETNKRKTPDERKGFHVVFNLYEFNATLNSYCDNVCRNNNMVDEARGTINFTLLDETCHNPAEYFRHNTTWQMLFIYTCHFLAHWETFQNYHHAHYDNHDKMQKSPFFNLFHYGEIVYK